jgi:hypothetical protein
VFLEPFSLDVKEKVDVGIPAFMYGTELSEVGLTKCVIPGFDYNKFYDIWSCPRLVINVAPTSESSVPYINAGIPTSTFSFTSRLKGSRNTVDCKQK